MSLIQHKNLFEVKDEKLTVEAGNNLFPVFLKLEQLQLLIIGGGNVALEKLQAVIQNSPATSIRLVSLTIFEKIYFSFLYNIWRQFVIKLPK